MISAPHLFSKCKLHNDFFVASVYPKKKQRNTICFRCIQVCEEIASFMCNECHFKTAVRDSEETAFQENTIARGNYKKLHLLSPVSAMIVLFRRMKINFLISRNEKKHEMNSVKPIPQGFCF